ncbi:MAG: hypothetical protein Q9204_002536 [Flavoplaca sp. TL-2023a]
MNKTLRYWIYGIPYDNIVDYPLLYFLYPLLWAVASYFLILLLSILFTAVYYPQDSYSYSTLYDFQQWKYQYERYSTGLVMILVWLCLYAPLDFFYLHPPNVFRPFQTVFGSRIAEHTTAPVHSTPTPPPDQPAPNPPPVQSVQSTTCTTKPEKSVHLDLSKQTAVSLEWARSPYSKVESFRAHPPSTVSSVETRSAKPPSVTRNRPSASRAPSKRRDRPSFRGRESLSDRHRRYSSPSSRNSQQLEKGRNISPESVASDRYHRHNSPKTQFYPALNQGQNASQDNWTSYPPQLHNHPTGLIFSKISDNATATSTHVDANVATVSAGNDIQTLHGAPGRSSSPVMETVGAENVSTVTEKGKTDTILNNGVAQECSNIVQDDLTSQRRERSIGEISLGQGRSDKQGSFGYPGAQQPGSTLAYQLPQFESSGRFVQDFATEPLFKVPPPSGIIPAAHSTNPDWKTHRMPKGREPSLFTSSLSRSSRSLIRTTKRQDTAGTPATPSLFPGGLRFSQAPPQFSYTTPEVYRISADTDLLPFTTDKTLLLPAVPSMRTLSYMEEPQDTAGTPATPSPISGGSLSFEAPPKFSSAISEAYKKQKDAATAPPIPSPRFHPSVFSEDPRTLASWISESSSDNTITLDDWIPFTERIPPREYWKARLCEVLETWPLKFWKDDVSHFLYCGENDEDLAPKAEEDDIDKLYREWEARSNIWHETGDEGKRCHVYGTKATFELDKIRCWVILNGYHFTKQRLPPKYKPRVSIVNERRI